MKTAAAEKKSVAPVFQNPVYAEAYAIMQDSAEELRNASPEEKTAFLKRIGVLPRARKKAFGTVALKK